MNFVNPEDIQVLENRQRREHDSDAHQELVGSIERLGLMHPLVVRKVGTSLVLVAGERRLRAVKEIFELGGTIRFNGEETPLLPVNELGELSPLDAMEAELEENIRRVDLSWQERALAEKALLELRQAQAEAAGTPISQTEVAAEARGDNPGAAQAFSKSIVLANNLHRPEVRAAKTASEAYKSLTRSLETERNVEKAQALGKDFLGSKHRLYNKDCLEFLNTAIEDGMTYDVIITDPPYGMGADEFGDSGGGAAGAHFYSDDAQYFTEVVLGAVELFSSVTAPDAHLYLFCDFARFGLLQETLVLTGWRVFRTPLIWWKPSAFRAPWPEQGPQRKYECILYAVKGDLKCTRLAGDVIQMAPEQNLGHHAQKPVELYKELLSRSVRPGMKVLDPFCGTGPIFPAAHALSAIATGVELDEGAFGIAATRIEKLK